MQSRWNRVKRRYAWCYWRLILLVFLMAEAAAAQPLDADELVVQGIELRKQGRDQEALERFRLAAAQSPSSPRLLGHLSLALHATEQWVESEQLMQEVLKAADDPWVIRHTAELKQSLDAVQDHLAWLHVESFAEGQLWLDGMRIKAPPNGDPLRVVARRCEIKLEIAGRPTITRTIDVPARSHWYVVMTAPSVPEKVSPKTAELLSRTAELPSKTSPAERPRSAPKSSLRRTFGTAVLGVAVTGLVTGVSLGIDAYVLRHRSRKECDGSVCSAEGIELYGRGRQAAALSTIALVVGTTSLGAAVVLLW
jgi:hypothetical protein